MSGYWRRAGIWRSTCTLSNLASSTRSRAPPQGLHSHEELAAEAAAAYCETEANQARPRRISWARLLKRGFDIDMHSCPNCSAGELKTMAAILERPAIETILTHLGQDPQPPPEGREAGPHPQRHGKVRLNDLSTTVLMRSHRSPLKRD